MALRITMTRLIPIYPTGVFLQWDLVHPTETGLYTFTVNRAGAEAGPWTTLVSGVTNTYNYLDAFPTTHTPGQGDLNESSLVRGIFYQVIVTPPSGAANQASVVSAVEPKLEGRQRLLKRKILYDEIRMLKHLNGVPVAVLKRMHWGTRCTQCYDKYTKDIVRSSGCKTCFGTSFQPGYFAPIQTLARRGVAPKQTQLTPQGKTDVAQAQVTLLDFPQVQEHDVLVFLNDNQRYVVEQRMPTELRTVTIHQKLVVSELAHNTIEYQVICDPLRIPPLF